MSLVHDLVKVFIGSEKGKLLLTSYWLSKEISNRVKYSSVVIRQEYSIGDGFIDVVWHNYRNRWVIAFEIKVGGTPAEFISQIDRYYERLSSKFKDVTIIGVVPESMINEIRSRLPEHLKNKVELIAIEPLSSLALKHLVSELRKVYEKHGFSMDWSTYSQITEELQEVLGDKRSNEKSNKVERYIILDIFGVKPYKSLLARRAGTALIVNKRGEVKRRYLDEASLSMLEEECRGIFEVTAIDHKSNYLFIKDAECLSMELIEGMLERVSHNLVRRRVIVVDEKYGIDVETGLRMYFDSRNWDILAPELRSHEVEFLAVDVATQKSRYGNEYMRITGFVPINIKKRPELSKIYCNPKQEFKGSALIVDSIELYETIIERDIGEKIQIGLIFLGLHEGYYPVIVSSDTEELVEQTLEYLDKGYLVEVELVKYVGAVSYIPKEIKKVYTIDEYLQNSRYAIRGKARLKRQPIPITVEAGNISIDFGIEYHVIDFEGSIILPITRNAKRLISMLKTNTGVTDIVAVVSRIIPQTHIGRKDKIIGIQFRTSR